MTGFIAILALSATLGGVGGLKAVRAHEVLQAAGHFGEWDTKYRPDSALVPHAGITIEVGSLPAGIGARTLRSRVVISQWAEPELHPRLVAHELGHIYFERACPSVLLSRGGAFLSESFAQWASRDHLRIGRGAAGDDGIYASQAIQWLQEQGMQKLPDPATLDRQVARVLITQRTNEQESRLDGFWRSFFSACRAIAGVSGEAQESSPAEALLKLLTGATPGFGREKPDFAYLDDLTGDITTSLGRMLPHSSDSTQRYPVASHLKPVLVALASESRREIPLGAGTLWECLNIPGFKNHVGPRLDWREALLGSCNGFFTGDASLIRGDSVLATRWREFWLSVGASRDLADASAVQEAIGLLPGATVSLREVLGAYRRLHRLQFRGAPAGSLVIDTLRSTASRGTLAGLPDSDWFLQSDIALKSGTVRDSQGRPEHGWIVAIGPRGREGFPAWYAAIHQQGASPSQLLGEFRARLASRFKGTAASHPQSLSVQLGSVVAEERLAIGCQEGGLMISRSERDWSFLGPGQFLEAPRLSRGDQASCASGPILLRSPDFKTGVETAHGRERAYPGRQVTWVARERVGPQAGPIKRARLGSRLVLETAADSYVGDVIAAEFPEGREATLGVLARAVYLNAIRGGTHRHPAQGAVCDSTHCQVYLGRSAVAEARKRRIERAVSALPAGGMGRSRTGKWFPFSLGGRAAWQKVVALEDINRLLNVGTDAFAVSRELERRIKDPVSCERIRNALKLSSCPREVHGSPQGIRFSGVGQGHGAGLDLIRAEELAQEGRSAEEIWEQAYPGH